MCVCITENSHFNIIYITEERAIDDNDIMIILRN